MSVTTYVDGMRRRSAADPDIVQAVVADTLQAVLPSALASASNTSTPSVILEEALARASQVLDERTLDIDISAITEVPGDFFRLTVFSAQTVSDLLDVLWGRIADFVPPFRYGLDWVLVDRQSHQPLLDLGTNWALRNHRDDDDRLLGSVGITPASELVAVRLDGSTRSAGRPA